MEGSAMFSRNPVLAPRFIFPSVIAALILSLFSVGPVRADNTVTSLVTDGQGILPGSGSIEILRVDAESAAKVMPHPFNQSGLTNAGDGYLNPITLTYSVP